MRFDAKVRATDNFTLVHLIECSFLPALIHLTFTLKTLIAHPAPPCPTHINTTHPQVVIPIQFVLFNLSAITGSAILYRDFEKAQFHQFVTFVYGCGATFAGVWVIAWDPNSSSSRSASNNSRSRTAPASGAEDGDRVAEEGGAELEISMAVGTGAGADGGAGAGQTAPGSVASSYGRRQRTGSMGRRKGIMGVFDLMEGEELDVGAVGSMPVLRTRHSAISLVGISPAQVCIFHSSARVCLLSGSSLFDWRRLGFVSLPMLLPL